MWSMPDGAPRALEKRAYPADVVLSNLQMSMGPSGITGLLVLYYLLDLL